MIGRYHVLPFKNQPPESFHYSLAVLCYLSSFSSFITWTLRAKGLVSLENRMFFLALQISDWTKCLFSDLAYSRHSVNYFQILHVSNTHLGIISHDSEILLGTETTALSGSTGTRLFLTRGLLSRPPCPARPL